MLFAEDEPSILNFTARFLRKENFRILLAINGPELFRLWKEKRPRAILSDIEMPGAMDGLGACRTIRKLDPLVRISLMTGNPENRRLAEENGFRVELFKPFSLEKLEAWAHRLRFMLPLQP